ncbi:MAG: TlyA family RNA methyltransferase [Spirochaetia bacterium]|nr:TlyA family RNA methyltransferase [Spirochaetia bacterium]
MNPWKKKLIEVLLEQGLEEQLARGMILSGKILVNGKRETRTGAFIRSDDSVLIPEPKKYVSRSALKLLGGLDDFGVSIENKICMDLGSSTGGFVQVLLEKGAKRVYAVDVGYGILDYSLRKNEKVTVLERCNVRNISASWFLPEDFEEIKKRKCFFVSCDISFMSIRTVLSSLVAFLSEEKIFCEGVLLLKPQFEDSRNTEKGILADESLRRKIVDDSVKYLESIGAECRGVRPSKIKGASGNQEYLISIFFSG